MSKAMILAVDPGPVTHGAAILCPREWPPKIMWHATDATIEDLQDMAWSAGCTDLVLERIASYGMSVGEEIFETVRQSAFLEYRVGGGLHHVHRIKRQEVKLAVCKSPRANDASIRQAIIDLYGGKEQGVGKKKAPGPLYGVKGDAWAAIAVGLTYIIQLQEGTYASETEPAKRRGPRRSRPIRA